MVSDTVTSGWHASAWDLVARLGAADGSAAHPYFRHLVSGHATARDLSDAVHALCAVHGHHPGLAAAALTRAAQRDAADWLDVIADAFAVERAYLAQLASAAGPLPSTPGQAATEAALIGERHALEMLARSDRQGCATGAAAALVLEWSAIRRILDAAATRFGVDVLPAAFPPEAETATSITQLGATPATERAISFGAQQLFAQHRGLWSLLDARASARAG